MPSLLLTMVPYGLGAAVNPTALTIELLVLTGKARPKARAWAYLLGFGAVLVGFVLLFVTVLGRLTPAQPTGRSIVSTVVDIGLVILLVGLGVRQLWPRRTTAERHQSRVASRLQSGGLPTYFMVGAIAMLTDFTTLVFLLPATHEVARSDESTGIQLLALLILMLIAILPLVLPILGLTLLGQRADRFLARTNAFVTRYPRQINASVCFFIAALVSFNAIKG